MQLRISKDIIIKMHAKWYNIANKITIQNIANYMKL